MKLIYIAGRYTGADFTEVENNIHVAKLAALQLWANGWAVICPHMNTAHMEEFDRFTGMGYQKWIDGTREILKRCDCIFMLLNWLTSAGAKWEHDMAEDLGLPIYYESQGYPRPGDKPGEEFKND